MSNFALFDGYDKTSTRYQTKRAFEVQKKNIKAKEQLKLLEHLLSKPEELDDDELLVYEKRYKSLLKLFKVVKNKDLNQLFIPFIIDHRTVIYIREKYCFKPKWVNKFGKKFIEERIKMYKEILEHKPKETIYWNPF